jgi:hypothetical protein
MTFTIYREHQLRMQTLSAFGADLRTLPYKQTGRGLPTVRPPARSRLI